MPLLCSLGAHRWSSRPTARTGTTLHRCARCGTKLLTHGGRPRRRKRSVVAAAMAVSAAIWFVGYNVVTTGRTRVIHTVSTAVRKTDVAASRGRAALHRVQGDRGAYLRQKD